MSVANVNSNHSPCTTRGRKVIEAEITTPIKADKKSAVKSKVVVPSTSATRSRNVPVVEFEEAGEIISMEVDVGEAAPTEFTSEGEDDCSTKQTDDSQTDNSESESDSEEGEISNPLDEEEEHEQMARDGTAAESAENSLDEVLPKKK